MNKISFTTVWSLPSLQNLDSGLRNRVKSERLAPLKAERIDRQSEDTASREEFIFLSGNLGEIVTVRLCNRNNFGIVFYQNFAAHHNPEFVSSSHPSLFLKLGEGQRARDLASLCFGWMDEHSGSLPGESCFSHKAISFHCFQSQNKKKLILKKKIPEEEHLRVTSGYHLYVCRQKNLEFRD